MILTIANQKGGTAKSTTAAALAQAASSRGKKVLALDLDPQANLTFFLGAISEAPGTYDLLTGKQPEIQATNGGIDVIAGSWDLQTVGSSQGSARRLQDHLKPIAAKYDFVIIDTPPTAGELQYNALMASDKLIIPLQADILGLQGLYQMLDTAAQIQARNPNLQAAGAVITRYTGRSTLERQMLEAIRSNDAIPLIGIIREAVAIREAQTMQQSIYSYAPKSKPALDYMQLFDTIMNA